ncbi:MAG: polyphenol oxidase family protein [bacterium]|nr:polyphenol oxidase family protein [bacterium]
MDCQFNKIEREGITYLLFDKIKWIKFYFSTKKRCEDQRYAGSIKLEKYVSFLNSVGIEEDKVATLTQVHGVKINTVKKPGRYDGDGLITDKRNLALSVLVADCIAISLYHPNGIIGILHAGRKGTEKGILSKALQKIKTEFGVSIADINIIFSPSICTKCYEVDLWKNNESIANRMGCYRIFNPKICTAENPGLFWSYRRDKGNTGRMLALVIME